MLRNLLTDDCYVVNAAGQRTGPFKTKFTPNDFITVMDEAFDAARGDALIQPLPNGKEVTYQISDLMFQSGVGHLKNFWKVEFLRRPPEPKQHLVSPTYNFHGANNVQIGDHNTQHIMAAIETLVGQIENAAASDSQKAEAKGLLRRFLEHPVVGAVAGGAASGLLGLLG